MYHLAWYFFIYAFLGWCMEVAYAAYAERRFVNRGFLNGPICPIYGVGVCIVYLVLMPFRKQWLLLFVGAVILTTALEGLTGLVLEQIFHQKWWDYSEHKYNWKGYICLGMSLLWGVACVIIVKALFPATDFLIVHIPKLLGIILLCVFCGLLAADLVTTVIVIGGLQKQMKLLFELSEKIREESDRIGKRVSKNAMELTERYETVAKRTHLLRRRLIQAFPKMKSSHYNEQLSELRRRIAEREIQLKLKRKRKKEKQENKNASVSE